jgi:hypothetical protein
MEPERCALHAAVGNDAECPRGWCAFWETGGAVVPSGCQIERLDIDLGNVDLAHYLLDLRRALEGARDQEEAARARGELTLLVPPDLSGA